MPRVARCIKCEQPRYVNGLGACDSCYRNHRDDEYLDREDFTPSQDMRRQRLIQLAWYLGGVCCGYLGRGWFG